MLKRSILRNVLAGVCFLVLGAGAAAADGINWTYVEAGYLGVDINDIGGTTFDGTGDNIYLGGAFGLKSIHILGQYANGEAATDIDLTEWQLGVGWHGLLGEKADLLGELHYLDTEYKYTVTNDKLSESGYKLDVGVRWRPIGLFEVNGYINYYGTDAYKGSETSVELRAILQVWRIGIGATYEKASDIDQYTGFVRFNFK